MESYPARRTLGAEVLDWRKIMGRLALSRFAVVIALLTPAFSARAQPVADSPGVEPEAVEALNKMGASLRALTSLALHADVTTEQVLMSGQKLQSGGTIDLKARRPDRLRMDIVSDRQSRSLYYDGKTATLYAPRLGYFATFQASPTIREMLANAEEKHGLDFPLTDLFEWGTSSSDHQDLQSAFWVDSETIKGHVCDQYAMRQEGQDWQVWIRQGANALPCKLVITTTDDSSMPQYSIVFDWQPATGFAADTFAFKAPADTRRIAIGVVPAVANGAE